MIRPSPYLTVRKIKVFWEAINYPLEPLDDGGRRIVFNSSKKEHTVRLQPDLIGIFPLR